MKNLTKRRLIESDDQESADFMRELRDVDPEKVRAFLDENLIYDPEHKVWKLVEFSDYTGNTADRANARYLIKNYPVIVPSTGPNFNAVIVGIPESSLGQLDSDMAASLFEQIKKLKTSGLLDEEEYRTVESLKRDEAWKHHYRQEFLVNLKQKFPDLDEEFIEDERLRGLFEDARDMSGAEWFEDTGADQAVDTSGIVERITPEMLSEWLYPDQGGVDAQIESIMEARKFSCVMAPASPDIVDAVQQFSRMFITDDKLYTDPEDPEGFGREDEVHVTVKFGLHEKDPSPELLKIIEQTEPFEIEVGAISLFENEKFDVVKFDISGEGLFKLNARISAELECTDTYPEYHPHMTVAYVTKGTCRELVGKRLMAPDEHTNARFLVKSVIFSSLTKAKTKLFLGKPNIEMEQITEDVVEPKEEEVERLSQLALQQIKKAQQEVDNSEGKINWLSALKKVKTEELSFLPSSSPAAAFGFVHNRILIRMPQWMARGNDDTLLSYLRRMIQHELVHRGQMGRMRPGSIPKMVASYHKQKQKPDFREKGYFNDPHEVMAFAKGFIARKIEKHGFDGAMKILQSPSSRPVFWNSLTPENQKQFLKYAYQYMMNASKSVGESSLSDYTANKAPGTHEATPWTRQQAETWLQMVRPALEAVGYEAEIVGSVDRHGESEKDLDILLTPLGDGHNVAAAMHVLAENSKWWGRADEDLFNAVLPDGHIVEFWFSGLQPLLDEEAYSDEATALPKGSLYHGKLAQVQEGFDEEAEADDAKDVASDGNGYKLFTDADVETSPNGQFPRIYADRKELIHDPTPWQKRGLQQTATGYGAKLNTGYRIAFNGKLYRLYSTTYGNAGSTWFIAKGRKIYVS